jgi:hypothetical protein
LVWGGFDITVASLRIRSNNPERPFALWLVSALALWLLERRLPRSPVLAFIRAAQTWLLVRSRLAIGLKQGLSQYVTCKRIAFLVSFTIFAVGYSNSSTAGVGSDSYGYLSQADLWLAGDLKLEQPWVAVVPWPDAANTFSPLGYRPAEGEALGTLVPTYSPGLPVLMALLKWCAGHAAAFWIFPVSGAILVLATFGIGRRLHSPVAGLVGAILVAASPPVALHVIQPMTDVPVAAAWAVAVYFFLAETPAAASFAGLAAAVAIVVRPNLVFLAPILGTWPLIEAKSTGRWHAALRRTALFGTFVACSVVTVGAINWHLYGSPLRSGYGNLGHMFAFSHILPNMGLYPAWLVETHTLGIVTGLAVWLWPWKTVWRMPLGRRFLPVGLAFGTSLWLTYFGYLVFDNWSYLRFVLPSWPFLMVGVGVVAATLVHEDRPWLVRFAGVAATVVLVASLVRWTDRHHLLEIGMSERDYVGAALAVQQATTSNSVILSMQHSGSLRYYGARQTLRYDVLDRRWLSEAVLWMSDHGFHVYAFLQDWEVNEFAARFVGDALIAELPLRTIMRYEGSSEHVLVTLTGSIGGAVAVERIFDSRLLRAVPPAAHRNPSIVWDDPPESRRVSNR